MGFTNSSRKSGVVSQNVHAAHISPSMSTLILRISKRKVPLLERLHLLYPLSRIGTLFRSGTVHPLLVAPAGSPPAGADSFPERISFLRPAHTLIAIRRTTSPASASSIGLRAFDQLAARPSLKKQPNSREIPTQPSARFQAPAMPSPSPPKNSDAARTCRTASLSIKRLQKRGFTPSCRTCARTGCCSSRASFPRCRCRNRPADR